MGTGPFQHLVIAVVAVCAGASLPPAARADGNAELFLVENTDVGGGDARLTVPLLISSNRGYRIRCASQGDEEAVIRGLGFVIAPSIVLDPASERLTAAAPQQNPLLCPNSQTYQLRVFHHNDASGDRFYLQFPEAFGATTYTNRVYVPGCKGLFDALKAGEVTPIEADPGPFFANAIHEIECKSGDWPDADPATFAAWCTKADLSAEQAKTVEALLAATPEGAAARGNAAGCQRAEAFLKTLPSVDLSGLDLTDLKPVAPLDNLTMLDVSDNRLADIAPLARLKNLRFLDLDANQLDNLSALGALPTLNDLDLADNKISNLRPLGALVALQKLDLSRNQVTDIDPLSRLAALTELKLAGNQLTGAAIEAVTGLSALAQLDLSDNLIETLEHISELPSTVTIRLDGNPVVANQSLSFADACILYRGNATPFGFTIRAMVEATGTATCQEAANALASNTTLALTGKGISDTRPLALVPSLRSLDLSGNAIVDVSPLARLTDLRQLNLATNSVRDIAALAALVNLDLLKLDANPLDVSSYLPACLVNRFGPAAPTDPAAAPGPLTAEQRAEIDALFAAAQKPNCLTSKEHLERVTALRIDGAQLTTLSYFGVLRRVTALELPNNQLADVAALAALPELARLDVSANQISSLQSFGTLTRLTGLTVSNNPLNSLNQLQRLQGLTFLDIRGTAVRVIRPLNTLPALEQARMRGLAIEYLGYEDYCLVDRFDSTALGPARAFVLAVAAVAAGQGVDTTNCQTYGDWAAAATILNLNKRDLTNIDPVRFFGGLKELYLYDNRIQDMSPVVGLRRLETLSLSTNQIASVPRLQSPAIKSLNLSENRIGNVAALADLQSVEFLYLTNNQIDNASPLRNLGRVDTLDLRNNRIQFMNGLAHWTLPRTYISGNPICDFLHESAEVVQACKRKPLLIIDIVRPFDIDVVLSPHVILRPNP